MTRKSGHHIITVVDDHGFLWKPFFHLERICNARDYKKMLLLPISSLKVLK